MDARDVSQQRVHPECVPACYCCNRGVMASTETFRGRSVVYSSSKGNTRHLELIQLSKLDLFHLTSIQN